MITGLEQSVLWALQLGTAGIALIVMFLMVVTAALFAYACIRKIAFMVERFIESEKAASTLETIGRQR